MSDTILKAIDIQPGIVKDLTEYMAEGGWIDCDKIRFRNGRPEKIGGWVRETATQAKDATNQLFTGVARAAISWRDLSFKKYLAVATHKKVELLNDGEIYDITPVRESPSLSDVISTTDTLPSVKITDTNHGLVVGDYVYVNSQAAPVGGITLAGSYTVTTVIDANNYTVTHSSNANATAALAGGALVIDYLLENGAQSNGNLTGWSGGTWGTEGAAGQGWNRPRTGVGGLNLRQWSLDTWGEDLVANVRYGKLYHWDATNGVGTRMVQITNAPTQNLFTLVSQPSRHLIAFGTQLAVGGDFDPLVIRWASQETLTEWGILDTNTAGEYRLPKGNFIIGACQTRSEIVVFTDTDVYSMRYVGGSDVFQFQPLGTNISAISQHAYIDINGVIIWMGLDKFYMYDGVVRVLPSTINKYIFDQDAEGKLNFDQKEKAYAGINKEFNEVMFFYPSTSATENDKYIKYNYIENVWDFGELDRMVWIDKSTFPRPYAINEEGRLYSHEIGKDADGAPLEAFIQTAYFDIDDGNDLMFVDRIVPDVRLPANRNIEITVTTKKYPHPAASVTTKGPYYFDDSDNKISLRARGRQMAITYRVTATGSDFEIGKTRIGFQPDGGR